MTWADGSQRETIGHWMTAGRPTPVYSISKTFVSAAVGLVVDDALMSYDDRVASYFADLAGIGPRAGSIRVRDCLAMATGHDADLPILRALLETGDDGFRHLLRTEQTGIPGEAFCYNRFAPYILSAIVRQVTGRCVHDLLRARLFDPLGCGPTAWQTDVAGRQLGFRGLHITPGDLARCLRLLTAGGVDHGQQLLSREWIAEHARPHTDSSIWEQPDWSLGYGWLVWRSRYGYDSTVPVDSSA